MSVIEHPNHRIVITGLGVVSSLGRTVETFSESLSKHAGGKSCSSVSEDEEETTPNGAADFTGRIQDFGDLPDDIRKRIRKALKVMNRETQIGVAAGQQALRSSRLCGTIEADRIGVCFGADNVSVLPRDFEAGIRVCTGEQQEFDFQRWGSSGIAEVEPLWMLKCLPNMAACHLAIINDLRGPNNTLTQRDLAFGMAVAQACRNIRSGDCDAMLVGATGTTQSVFNLIHARLEHEVGEGAEAASSSDDCHPVPSEGAGSLVLESLQTARERGATIYGEILGTASASFVGHDGESACGRALTGAIQQALRLARLSPDSVGHIHTCGLDSSSAPSAESQAITEVFGSETRQVPVVAAKRRFGHAGAGAAALELIASLLAVENGRLFPMPVNHDPTDHGTLRSTTGDDQSAGENFLSLSLFRRGLANCIAVGTYSP